MKDAAIIFQWDDAWGIPAAEVASPSASSALPLNSPITFFLLYLVSLHLFEKPSSLQEGSACSHSVQRKPLLHDFAYQAQESQLQNLCCCEKTQHFESYVPNIKHTGLRGPEKGGGDKINGFNWE